jgi:integrase
MATTKVTLRKRLLSSGKVTLYLDFYPPVRNPRTNQLSRREYLGIQITKNPKTQLEKSDNAEKLKIAEAVRSQRELSLMNEQFGFIDKTKQKLDFLEYFLNKVNTSKSPKNFNPSYLYFKLFVKDVCTFSEITIDLCNNFRTYLLSAKQLKQDKMLHKNTASYYFQFFKFVLHTAYKEKFLLTDLSLDIAGIKLSETHREFLTLQELNLLANTECPSEKIKRASLFSALTGLRFSDIKNLKWSDIFFENNKISIHFKIQKTQKYENLPISKQALEFCGQQGVGDASVFSKLPTNSYITLILNKWTTAAGIDKKITFHCFRHTFATLQLTHNTDIYTVSKMLGHASVKTTQIYAKIIDEKKEIAANAIKLSVS